VANICGRFDHGSFRVDHAGVIRLASRPGKRSSSDCRSACSRASVANRHRYWKLLCQLYERRRSGRAAPPSFGFPTREITRDIEEELQAQDEWELESGERLETPVGIRAIEIFNRLRDSVG